MRDHGGVALLRFSLRDAAPSLIPRSDERHRVDLLSINSLALISASTKGVGLAELTKGTAVTVNAVLPGPTRSEGVEEFVDKLSRGKPFAEFENEFFEKVLPTSLLKRFDTVDEIAHVVAFVCSTFAAGINGSSLRVEGGLVKAIA